MKYTFLSKVKKLGKLTLAMPNFAKIILSRPKEQGKRAVLIGTPVHCNIGDHLIAEQAMRYLQFIGFSDILEVPEFVYELFPSHIKINSEDIIFINGGGWMGEDYEDEDVIEDVILRYPHNHIIILPQTVHISSENIDCIDRMSRIFNSSDKVIVSVREKISYETCINMLKINPEKVFLLPDMGLLRDFQTSETNSRLALFSMRDDIERIDNPFLTDLERMLIGMGYDIKNTSTVINRTTKNIPPKHRSICLEKKISEFSNAKIVVTDRLHSMILAIISGTKCIAFDNSTHKVKGVMEAWLKYCPRLLFWDDTVDLPRVQSFIEDKKFDYHHDYINDFQPLTVYIRSIINGHA